MGVTIKDLAKAAGVSDATVSLALSGHPRISEKTRERIRQVAEELHYFPNLSARSLRNGPGQTIGFLVSDLGNPLYVSMVQQVEEMAAKRGYQVVIAESQWDAARELKAIESLVSQRVKGVLVILTEQTQESLRLLEHSRLPVVAVDTAPAAFKGAFIGNDLVAAGEMAVAHLVESGCRYPVLLGPQEAMSRFSAFAALQQGFLKGLKKHRLASSPPPVIAAGLTIREGMTGMDAALRLFPEVDGLLCANDLCAFGAITAAEQAGKEIGSQLRIMGIDDLEFSSLPRISLTSLSQPYDRIAETSTQLLLDHIEKKMPLLQRMIYPPELKVRATTGGNAVLSLTQPKPKDRRRVRSL